MKNIAFGLLVAGAAIASAQSDRTVLVVNGEEIKASEYYYRMEFLPDYGRMLEGGVFEKTPPGLLTLQLLVEERIILQCAKDNGVSPTDAEVAAGLAEKKKRNPEFYADVAKQGISDAQLLYQERLEIAQFKLLTKGINVTDIEVQKFYTENPAQFTDPRRMKLSIIVTNAEGRAAVDAALKGGKPFADVARELSQDISKKNGGSLGAVEVEQFSQPIRDALEKIKIGQMTDWLQGETVYLKMLKEDVLPAKLRPLDAELKTTIRRTLMIDRGMAKNDLAALLKETRKKAVIELKQPAFQSQFQAFLNRYKLGVNR